MKPKFLKIYCGVAVTAHVLLSSVAFTTIPEEIYSYLKESRERISLGMPLGLSQEQTAIIVDKLAERIENRFAKVITRQRDYQRGELVRALNDIIDPSSIAKNVPPLDSETQTVMWRELAPLMRDFENTRTVGPMMFIKFQGYSLPFAVKRIVVRDNQEVQLKLKGYPDDTCLKISLNFKQRTAVIDWLGTHQVLCPTPKNNQGNFLLDFTEALAKSLALSRIRLIDGSEIACAVNKNEKLDFRLLRTIQTGQGWYESKGYVLTRPSDKKIYDDNIAAFLNYPLQDVLNELKQPDIKRNLRDQGVEPQIITEAIKTMSTYERFFPGSRFVKFMANLYLTSCSDYRELAEMIFRDFVIEKKLFTIEQIYPKLPTFIEKRISSQ